MAKIFHKPDYILLAIIGIILILGIIILASVSAPFAEEKFGSTSYFLRHQLLYGLLPGLLLGLFAFKINLSFLKRTAPFFFLFNLILMVLVFFPLIGSHQLGSSRWLNFGPVSFQPAEFLKLTFILYLAGWLAVKTEKNKKTNDKNNQIFFVFLTIIALISLLLILQPNISTLGVIAFVGLLMYFSAKTPWWQTIVMILLGAGGLFSLMKIASYRASRLLVFFNPEVDPMGIGYQAKQATIAIGSGGITGTGLGMSIQKLGFLPQPIADSIFAVFSEETGFAGAFILVSLFLIFLLRSFKIVKEAPDKFSQLAALGITCWIVVQAFVNMGAMIGILPLTGIPLPFISYGGSALITELIGVGILLNISKNI